MSLIKLFKNLVYLLAVTLLMGSCKTEDILPAATLSISNVVLTADENIATLTATLNAEGNEQVLIPLVFTGDAVLNEDFTVSNNQIVIERGQTSASVQITFTSSGTLEGTRNLIINARSATGTVVSNGNDISISLVGAGGGFNFLADNFNYVSGTALTTNGWFAHSGIGNNPIMVSTSGLSWNGYVGSGTGNAALVNNTGEDVNRPLVAKVDTGSAYVSFLVNVSAPFLAEGEGYFLHYATYENETPNTTFSNVTTAHRGRTFVALGSNPNTQFKLGLSFNAGTPSGSTPDLNIGQTYLVVLKYTFIEGSNNDLVSLYVFAEGDDISVEPTTPTLGPLTGTAADAISLQALALRQYNANQNITVDGIYVRNQWNLTSTW